MKKILKGIVALSLLMGIPLTIQAENDYAANEDFYHTLCSKDKLSEEEKKVCSGFFDYLKIKSENIEDEIKQLEEDMKNISKNIQTLVSKIKGYDTTIAAKEKEITTTQNAITRTQLEINSLLLEIEQREKDIEELDKNIKERMVLLQSVVSTNGFIDFLMGAKDFVDLIRRFEGISDITSYDKENIKLLNEEIKKLENNKVEVENKKSDLIAKKSEIEKSKEQIIKLKEQSEIIVKEYRSQEAELEAKQNIAADNLDQIQQSIKDIEGKLNATWSNGFIRPIANGYVSAGSWQYPSSFCSSTGRCLHLGIDLAAPVGRAVVAPATSLVLNVYDKCPTYGSLGDFCGGGIGNYIILATEVNNTTYAIIMAHMKSGFSKYVKWPSNEPVVVKQGQTVAEVGSSGSSTGPHSHVEVINLGSQSIEQVAQYYARTGDRSFGLGYGTTGYNNRCEVKSAPCRQRPETIFNLKYGQWW